MRKQSWLLCGGLSACLALSLTAAVPAADDPMPTKTTTKEPADPPGTTIYMAQFRLLFDSWDLNGDGYLDKAELAKAFRGPTARPYDYKPASKDKKDDKDPKDDKKDSTPKDSTTKKPNYSKYPDYNFLIQLDQDNDEMISRHEFLSWGRDVSVQFKAQADLQHQLAALQAKLAKAKVGSKTAQKLQNQINKLNSQIQTADNQVASQVKSLDNKVLQQLRGGKKH